MPEIAFKSLDRATLELWAHAAKAALDDIAAWGKDQRPQSLGYEGPRDRARDFLWVWESNATPLCDCTVWTQEGPGCHSSECALRKAEAR